MIMKTDDQLGYSCHLGVRITWAELKSELTRSDALERVTRIELAWPAWKESAHRPERNQMRLLV